MSLKTRYLLLYNLTSLLAWTVLTARVLQHVITTTSSSPPLEDDLLLPYVTLLEAAAVAEVAHAALGLVRASAATTALQTGGRNLVVWTVMRRFPGVVFASASASTATFVHDAASSSGGGFGGFGAVTATALSYGRVAFVGCLLAWGVSDVVRYAFFVAMLVGGGRGGAPGWLKWLRYTAFIPLYPVGFLSEAYLVFISLVGARDIGPIYRGYLFIGLLAYIPASYILYTYMFSQRRRALGQADHAKTK